jgi:hypothetical protein
MCALLTPLKAADLEHSPTICSGIGKSHCFLYVPVESVLPRTAAGPADGALLVHWQRIEGESADILENLSTCRPNTDI